MTGTRAGKELDKRPDRAENTTEVKQHGACGGSPHKAFPKEEFFPGRVSREISREISPGLFLWHLHRVLPDCRDVPDCPGAGAGLGDESGPSHGGPSHGGDGDGPPVGRLVSGVLAPPECRADGTPKAFYCSAASRFFCL